MAKYNLTEKKEKEAAYRSLVSPKLMDELEAEARAAVEADGRERLLPRRSPGYGEMPLALSREILEKLDATRKIGVALTESLSLVPTKSVTAICEVELKS